MASDAELRDKLAAEYSAKIFELSPDGFTVAPYCNSEMFAASFEAGWDAARANPEPEVDALMGVMSEALQWSFEMFLARDEMNAKVHCAPVRLSPITERVQSALAAYKARGGE